MSVEKTFSELTVRMVLDAVRSYFAPLVYLRHFFRRVTRGIVRLFAPDEFNTSDVVRLLYLTAVIKSPLQTSDSSVGSAAEKKAALYRKIVAGLQAKSEVSSKDFHGHGDPTCLRLEREARQLESMARLMQLIVVIREHGGVLSMPDSRVDELLKEFSDVKEQQFIK